MAQRIKILDGFDGTFEEHQNMDEQVLADVWELGPSARGCLCKCLGLVTEGIYRKGGVWERKQGNI